MHEVCSAISHYGGVKALLFRTERIDENPWFPGIPCVVCEKQMAVEGTYYCSVKCVRSLSSIAQAAVRKALGIRRALARG